MFSSDFTGKLLKLFFLSSLSTRAFSAPTDITTIEVTNNELHDFTRRKPLPNAVPIYTEDQNDLLKRQDRGAGLAWGPEYWGQLKAYLTNPHTGYGGPKFPSAIHENFHVDRKSGRKYNEVANLHIVPYGPSCVYVWESKSGKTVMDRCFGNWPTATARAVEEVQDFLKGVVKVADLVALAAAGVALAAVIVLTSPVAAAVS